MPRIALLTVPFALAACAELAGQNTASAPDPSGWQFASGKPPSKAEFAALSATCEAKCGAVETCLVNLGLKRAK
jgi:hypothetical protein